MIDFVGRRRWYALISALMLIPSLAALAIWQFRPGLDFTGGLETEVRFLAPDASLENVQAAAADAEVPDDATLEVVETDDATFLVTLDLASVPEGGTGPLAEGLRSALAAGVAPLRVDDQRVDNEGISLEVWFPFEPTQDAVRDAMRSIDEGNARIQPTANATFKIRVEEPEDGDLEALRRRINAALESQIGPIFVLQSESVSGLLSAEIARDAGIALGVAAVAILIYISLAFRRLPNPALYGAAAVVALMHDITIVCGAFAVAGQVAGLEVNAMFITGLLAIIGYSVNDTIVVFDRIRETQLLDPGQDLRAAVNAATTQTLGRSLNTSIVVFLALLALVLIGGVTVRPFVIVLLVGTVAGTYSSIGIASQVVVLWHEGSIQKLWPFGGGSARRGSRQTA